MPTLFEKVKIGNLELKNRVFMAPMDFHTPIPMADTRPSDRILCRTC